MIAWADSQYPLRLTPRQPSSLRVGPQAPGGHWECDTADLTPYLSNAGQEYPLPAPALPCHGIALGVLLGAFLWSLIGVTISWMW